MTRWLLPIANARDTWRALRVLLRPRRAFTLITVTVLVAQTVVGLVAPAVLGHMVDLVVEHREPGALTAPAILLGAIALVQAVLVVLGGVLVSRLGETALASVREDVVDRALSLPIADIEQAGTGDLVSRVSGDVAVTADAVRSVLPTLSIAGLTVALTIVGLLALDWRFALAGLCAAPVQAYTLRWYLRRSAPVYAAERVAEGARAQQLLETVSAAATVRAFDLGTDHVRAIDERSQAALECNRQAVRLRTRFYGRLNLAEYIGLAAILATGFVLVGDGHVTVGATTAAALYFHRLFDPINELLGLFDSAQSAAAGFARLVGIMQLPPLEEPAEQLAPRDGSIRATGLRFAYTAGHEVLHGVDLHVESGQRIALVGASGAGKTTLAKLVAGIQDPDEGCIVVGHVALEQLGATGVRRAIALVTQEVHVFAGSVADDLRLVRPGATEVELLHALDAVGAGEWVRRLPEQLDTEVGEGGHRLSIMQAQQLALARLMLADPAIAILDEATAEAGSAGARLLERSAAAAIDGRTAVIVAHRLSQAAACDRILVMDRGEIVESGSHDELVRAAGSYAELWHAWSLTH